MIAVGLFNKYDQDPDVPLVPATVTPALLPINSYSRDQTSELQSIFYLPDDQY
jgi:hypothetical protein